MVLYQNSKAGVVIGVERDTIKIVNEQNEVELVRVSDIQSKVTQKRSQSTDRNRRLINQDDIVKVCDGPNMGKKGTILHLYRDIVFLHNKQMTDTLGVYIEKA